MVARKPMWAACTCAQLALQPLMWMRRPSRRSRPWVGTVSRRYAISFRPFAFISSMANLQNGDDVHAITALSNGSGSGE
jgi:hypothetical protein